VERLAAREVKVTQLARSFYPFLEGACLQCGTVLAEELKSRFEKDGNIGADLNGSTVYKVGPEFPIPDLFGSRVREDNILGNR
jgi:hypothetical protein